MSCRRADFDARHWEGKRDRTEPAKQIDKMIQEKIDGTGFIQGNNGYLQTDQKRNRTLEELGVLFLGDRRVGVDYRARTTCECDPDIGSIIRQYDVVASHFLDSV